MGFKLDYYVLITRLLPTYLIVFPLAVLFFILFPQFQSTLDVLIGILVSLGLTVLLAQVGRDAGKRKEFGLFALWGGVPTSRILSHIHTNLEKSTLRRYHNKLRFLVAEIEIPSEHEEYLDEAAAMEVYASCTKYLRETTRDKDKFYLIFSENVNYGFRRNLWGMKPAGIFTSSIGLLGCAGSCVYGFYITHTFLPVSFVGSLVCSLMLTFWILRINPTWVKLAADAYAERLVCALDII